MSKVSSAIDETEAQKILDQHNCARRRHGLNPLKWDWQLAADAQQHADRCIWEHASAIGKGVPGQGENMSLAMGRPVNVQGWLDEEAFYDCVNAKCRKQPCGHWTQMVWHDTARVGCGKQTCPSVQSAPGFLNSEILICRYAPPGNYRGRRMMKEQNCALGAANRACSGEILTETEVDEQPIQEYVEIEKEQDTLRTSLNPSTTSRGNLFRVGADPDQFTAEQRRIESLTAEQRRQRETARPQSVIVFTTSSGKRLERPIRSVIGYQQPTGSGNTVGQNVGNYERSESEVPVFADPRAQVGYQPADERFAEQKSFAWQIGIAIAIFVLALVVALAYFGYRKRAILKRRAQSLRKNLAQKVAPE